MSAVEQSVLAEELGFDSVFMTEHHFSRHGIVPDNLAMLAFIAAKTSRIRLGTAVSVLPLHDPIRLAESAALVDVLSNGRLEFGIGRGYQWGEFDGFALDLSERVSRFDESIEVILRAWSSELGVTHEGEHWRYRNATPYPQPVQQPHPPIWMATTSRDGFERCVAGGWGVMLPQAVSLKIVAQWVAEYREVCDEFEVGFDASKLILARGLHIAVSDELAWSDAGSAYQDFLERAVSVAAAPGGEATPLTFDLESIGSTALICSAQTATEKLQEIRKLGIENVIFFSNMGGLAHELVVESLQHFAEQVMPRCRSL